MLSGGWAVTQAVPRLIVFSIGALLVATQLFSGCGGEQQGGNVDPDQVDSTALPETGACRKVSPDDLADSSNASEVVPCTEKHTAETIVAMQLPEEYDDAAYDDRELGIFAAKTCAPAFTGFLGSDESTSMRTILSWAWFRPSETAWNSGARWLRCDVVGGSMSSAALVMLPRTTKNLLASPKDKWMACVNAPSVSDAPRIPCSEPHVWRAVTTIKLGPPEAEYPGDKEVVSRTKDFCSGSVSAWLDYPPDFDFGYTWFGSMAWEGGNRRSVCWARTNR
jgi:Septum formation